MPRIEYGDIFTDYRIGDCGCNAGFRGGIVLDPFVGSGTTLQVAKELNRSGFGIDIQDNYKPFIEKRIRAKDWSIESFF